MAFLGLWTRRQLPWAASRFVRVVRRVRPPAVGLHGAGRLRAAEKGPWGKIRAAEQQQYQLADLDKADALMLRKSHETGFLSWFRNGLLATGIGVIAYVQSEVGREAGYAFFMLGGICVSFGAASYVGSLFVLRRMMLLSVPALLLQGAVVGSAALFWLCAVSLYIGRLEVEIIHEDGMEEDDCEECQERRDHSGYSRRRRHQDEEEDDQGKASKK
ncbi:transmembrane protein 160 [Synchiropus splendidus]|uniref:transmembrane protein 160 n=1 Tax=Synchiropus splendidus TaxID=270530 RepID=UPI00237D5F3C|nr:transmembrane protein 160 [Synchiropus splendidus]